MLLDFPPEILYNIIKQYNSPEILQKLLCTSNSFRQIFYNDQYFRRIYIDKRKSKSLIQMFKNGYTECIKLIIGTSKLRMPMTKKYIENAYKNGRIGTCNFVADYCLEKYGVNGTIVPYYLVPSFIFKSQVRSLKIFVSLDQWMIQTLFEAFTASGNYEALQFYAMNATNKEQKFEMYIACHFGQNEVVKMYVNNGLKVDSTCAAIAIANHQYQTFKLVESIIGSDLSSYYLDVSLTSNSCQIFEYLVTSYFNDAISFLKIIRKIVALDNLQLLTLYYETLRGLKSEEHHEVLKLAILMKSTNIVSNYSKLNFKSDLSIPEGFNLNTCNDKYLSSIIVCEVIFNVEDMKYLFMRSTVVNDMFIKLTQSKRYSSLFLDWCKENKKSDEMFRIIQTIIV